MAWCPICERFLEEAERKNNMVGVSGKGPTCGTCSAIIIKYENKKMGGYWISQQRAREFKKHRLVRQASGPYTPLRRSSTYINLADYVKENSYGSVKPTPPPLTRTSSYIGLDDILKEKK